MVNHRATTAGGSPEVTSNSSDHSTNGRAAPIRRHLPSLDVIRHSPVIRHRVSSVIGGVAAAPYVDYLEKPPAATAGHWMV